MARESKTFSKDILIPRRIVERQENRLKSVQRLLQQTRIEGDLDLEGIPITDLGNVEYVGGYLDLRHTVITSLGNLKFVGRSLDLRDTPITDLG